MPQGNGKDIEKYCKSIIEILENDEKCKMAFIECQDFYWVWIMKSKFQIVNHLKKNDYRNYIKRNWVSIFRDAKAEYFSQVIELELI